jgi:hypothetical protein
MINKVATSAKLGQGALCVASHTRLSSSSYLLDIRDWLTGEYPN